VLHFLAPDVNWIPVGLEFKFCNLNFLSPSNIYSKVHNKHTFTYNFITAYQSSSTTFKINKTLTSHKY